MSDSQLKPGQPVATPPADLRFLRVTEPRPGVRREIWVKDTAAPPPAPVYPDASDDDEIDIQDEYRFQARSRRRAAVNGGSWWSLWLYWRPWILSLCVAGGCVGGTSMYYSSYSASNSAVVSDGGVGVPVGRGTNYSRDLLVEWFKRGADGKRPIGAMDDEQIAKAVEAVKKDSK